MKKPIFLFFFILFVINSAFIYSQETVYADIKYGFNPTSSQQYFYNAINNEKGKGNTLIFKNMGSPWYIEDPLRLFDVNNLTIIFEPGCVIEAKQGSWKAGEKLIEILRADQLNIIGYGATFKMYKSDFQTIPDGTQTSILESGHSVSIVKASNISIKGLTLDGSGGDGIYVKEWKNGLIEDLDALNHTRQGISIISCNELDVRHCRFRNTSGRAPEAGVDIEPNNNQDNILGCRFSYCSFTGNDWVGMAVALSYTNFEAEPIDVSFKHCYSANNNVESRYKQGAIIGSKSGFIEKKNDSTGDIIFIGKVDEAVNGKVLFENIAIDGNPYEFFASRKQFEGYTIEMNNIAAINIQQQVNPGDTDKEPLINFETPSYYQDSGNGGIYFNDVLIHTTKDVLPLKVRGTYSNTPSQGNYLGLKRIDGNVTIVEPHSNDPLYINYDPINNEDVTLSFNSQTSLPETIVTIEATALEASKTGALGIATIKRTSQRIDYPLFVKYKVETTDVIEGDNIHYLTGAVVIKANETEAVIQVAARQNNKIEDNKSISLKLEERALYTIGSNNTAQIYIVDKGGKLYVNDILGQVSSYSESDHGKHETFEDNKALLLKNKSWKKIEINQSVTKNTILEFEFKIDPNDPGRIHGIGFDNDNQLFYSDLVHFFQLAGTYRYDETDANDDPIYNYYTEVSELNQIFANGWVKYSIPIGDYFTGDFNYLTFGSSSNNGEESYFRNIVIREADKFKVSGLPKTVTSYSVEDTGSYETFESGNSLRLKDKAKKKVEVNQSITENTILEFEFKIDPNDPGRIHGIGFDNDNQLFYSDLVHFFQLAGTYRYDETDANDDPIYNYYTEVSELNQIFANGWVKYTIPLGDYFTGDFNYLTFTSSSNNGEESYFRNVSIINTVSTKINTAKRIYNNKEEKGLTVYPVPASNLLIVNGIHENTELHILNSLGQIIEKISGSGDLELNIEEYTKGMYFIVVKKSNEVIKFIKE